jgi:hypothetical protein
VRSRCIPPSSVGATGPSLDLGVRQRVTGRGAPVEVTILAVAEGGYGSSRGSTDGPASLSTRQTSWALGGNVGLAVDRELTSGLTLRVATAAIR